MRQSVRAGRRVMQSPLQEGLPMNGILVKMEDFTEHDIRKRDKQIYNEFIKYLKDERLLKG